MTPSTSEPFFQSHSITQLDDRRRRDRTPPLQEGTHIWLKGNRRVRVELIDESPDGIGVVIPDMSFNLGPRIEIEYEGELRTATVAYLNKNSNGQYRLGLEWLSLRDV